MSTYNDLQFKTPQANITTLFSQLCTWLVSTDRIQIKANYYEGRHCLITFSQLTICIDSEDVNLLVNLLSGEQHLRAKETPVPRRP